MLGLESCTALEEIYLSHNGIRQLEVCYCLMHEASPGCPAKHMCWGAPYRFMMVLILDLYFRSLNPSLRSESPLESLTGCMKGTKVQQLAGFGA